MLSSIHSAVETQVKINYFGQPVIKPFVVHDYNIKMGGVNTTDNFLFHYIPLKCFKWLKKLLLHFITMIILNAYILNRKYGTKKMSHSACREYIALYLITTSLETATCTKRKTPVPVHNMEMRLSGKHFISKLDTVVDSKRKVPAQKCKVCNFTHEQLAHYGHNNLQLPNKYSSYRCKTWSNITLCITPCFEIFHSSMNYRERALTNREMTLQEGFEGFMSYLLHCWWGMILSDDGFVEWHAVQARSHFSRRLHWICGTVNPWCWF